MGRLDPVPHRNHGCGIADISLLSCGLSTSRLDLGDERVGGRGVTRVVDDDDGTVAGQPFGNRGANAARRAGDECNFGLRHVSLPMSEKSLTWTLPLST